MRLKNFNLTFGTQIFKAFSDEARSRILYLLFKRKELTISDLVSILDFTQTKTSRHITYLKNAGLVTSRKQDQWVFYSVKDEVYDMITLIFDFLSKDAQLLNDLAICKTMDSNRELAKNKIEAKKYQS